MRADLGPGQLRRARDVDAPSQRVVAGGGSGAVGGLGGGGGGLVDGSYEERCHLGSGYGLVGAVVEGAGGAPSGYTGLVHAFYGPYHGGVGVFGVLEEAFGLGYCL